MKMTVEKLKKYPGMVIIKKETETKLKKLRDEIEALEARMSRAKKKCEPDWKVETLLGIKQERLRVTERLLEKLEKNTLEVETALDAVASELSPLEYIVIQKHYVEGMNWNRLMDEFQTKPEYSQFCYERSSYMRAHRSALDKLIALEAE